MVVRQPPAALVVLAALNTPVQQQAPRLHISLDGDDLSLGLVLSNINLGELGLGGFNRVGVKMAGQRGVEAV